MTSISSATKILFALEILASELLASHDGGACWIVNHHRFGYNKHAMKHLRAYRYVFTPTPEQAENLAQTFGCARWVYNWALDRRSTHYQSTGQSLSKKQVSAALTTQKAVAETAWLSEVSSVTLQQSLRHLDAAFAKFFKKTAAYPVFKRRSGHQSVSYMNNAFTFRDGKLVLAKQSAPLAIRWSRPLPKDAVPSSVTVSRTPSGRYFVSLLVEEDIAPLPAVRSEVGIDLNTKEIVRSNGRRERVPERLTKLAQRRRRYQRACARKVEAVKRKLGIHGAIPKGARLPVSNNLAKQRCQVASINETIGNVRRDWQHKLTTGLVRENQTIVLETLNTKGMTASAKGTADAPGKNVKAKSGLNRSILNVGFGEIARQIEYKAAWYQRTIVKIDRWFPSSKTCSCCGHRLKKLPLSKREWICPSCGKHHDRDHNAAVNILGEGKRILAGGFPVSACGAKPSACVACVTATSHRVETGKASREAYPAGHRRPGIPVVSGEDINKNPRMPEDWS